MPLDLGIFFLRQPAFFINDGICNADLAYIMQQAGIIDLITFLLVLARQFRDLFRILRHACRVSSCIGILRIDGTGQSLCRLFK